MRASCISKLIVLATLVLFWPNIAIGLPLERDTLRPPLATSGQAKEIVGILNEEDPDGDRPKPPFGPEIRGGLGVAGAYTDAELDSMLALLQEGQQPEIDVLRMANSLHNPWARYMLEHENLNPDIRHQISLKRAEIEAAIPSRDKPIIFTRNDSVKVQITPSTPIILRIINQYPGKIVDASSMLSKIKDPETFGLTPKIVELEIRLLEAQDVVKRKEDNFLYIVPYGEHVIKLSTRGQPIRISEKNREELEFYYMREILEPGVEILRKDLDIALLDPQVTWNYSKKKAVIRIVNPEIEQDMWEISIKIKGDFEWPEIWIEYVKSSQPTLTHALQEYRTRDRLALPGITERFLTGIVKRSSDIRSWIAGIKEKNLLSSDDEIQLRQKAESSEKVRRSL